MAERIQKVLANLGLGSRREIEKWVKQGRLMIGNKTAQLGDKLHGNESVYLDGRLVGSQRSKHRKSQCLIYHKPIGEVCTRKDPDERSTIFDHLQEPRYGRWINVGRLDINSSGLIILTTDGELAHRLMHPSYEISRIYAVRVLGRLSRNQIEKLIEGVKIEGFIGQFNSIKPRGGSGANYWYEVTLTEGKNREVRRLFEAVGITVSRLLRIAYGSIEMGELRRGKWRLLTREESAVLYKSVKLCNPT
ncbi:MAG: 23S rRNA pseudouridylate synthase B [Rhodospirillaceae bacterium]|nr:23S rRNA pseudouridylate synthase B [Rhodospirillaceae bacterium]